jgi:hypothetical protein
MQQWASREIFSSGLSLLTLLPRGLRSKSVDYMNPSSNMLCSNCQAIFTGANERASMIPTTVRLTVTKSRQEVRSNAPSAIAGRFSKTQKLKYPRYTREEIRESAKAGCAICKILCVIFSLIRRASQKDTQYQAHNFKISKGSEFYLR